MLGRPTVGLALGAMMELIWISRPPLGGQIPPNACLTSVIVTAGVLLCPFDATPALLSAGLLLGLPLARLAAVLERRLRQVNAYLTRLAMTAATGGRGDLVWPYNLLGLAGMYLFSFLFVLVFLTAHTLVLGYVYLRLPAFLISALSVMPPVFPLVGIAAALSNLTVRRTEITFGVVFAALLFVFAL
jgi:mannose/fructose/N-acetylgalactosamine-specific phosphotransferase system component IIC